MICLHKAAGGHYALRCVGPIKSSTVGKMLYRLKITPSRAARISIPQRLPLAGKIRMKQ
jgi:hypothetical protein